jgi:hypothetical protein
VSGGDAAASQRSVGFASLFLRMLSVELLGLCVTKPLVGIPFLMLISFGVTWALSSLVHWL